MRNMKSNWRLIVKSGLSGNLILALVCLLCQLYGYLLATERPSIDLVISANRRFWFFNLFFIVPIVFFILFRYNYAMPLYRNQIREAVGGHYAGGALLFLIVYTISVLMSIDSYTAISYFVLLTPMVSYVLLHSYVSLSKNHRETIEHSVLIPTFIFCMTAILSGTIIARSIVVQRHIEYSYDQTIVPPILFFRTIYYTYFYFTK